MKVGERMEALGQSIAAAIWPIIEAALDGLWQVLRALVLGLFGGVPREVAEQLPSTSPAAREGAAQESDDRPRWREAAIRRCLGRRAEGSRREHATLPICLRGASTTTSFMAAIAATASSMAAASRRPSFAKRVT